MRPPLSHAHTEAGAPPARAETRPETQTRGPVSGPAASATACAGAALPGTRTAAAAARPGKSSSTRAAASERSRSRGGREAVTGQTPAAARAAVGAESRVRRSAEPELQHRVRGRGAGTRRTLTGGPGQAERPTPAHDGRGRSQVPARCPPRVLTGRTTAGGREGTPWGTSEPSSDKGGLRRCSSAQPGLSGRMEPTRSAEGNARSRRLSPSRPASRADGEANRAPATEAERGSRDRPPPSHRPAALEVAGSGPPTRDAARATPRTARRAKSAAAVGERGSVRPGPAAQRVAHRLPLPAPLPAPGSPTLPLPPPLPAAGLHVP